MSLNIMIAGCTRDERDGVEASVKAAFGDRADTEPWNVSLVNIANQWSIEIDGPEPPYKGLSLVAASTELTTCLREALVSAGNGAGEPGAAPSAPGNGASAASQGERQERHECEECAAPFQVQYAALDGEGTDLFPVACPHCWHVNKVPIAESAGTNGDYSARAI
jgi:hypothetical protein